MPTLIIILLVILQGIIFGVATNKALEYKGYDEDWFWYGFLFSFVAFILAATRPLATTQIEIEKTKQKNSHLPPKRDTWTCPICFRINPSYTGTCACGTNKNTIKDTDTSNTNTI